MKTLILFLLLAFSIQACPPTLNHSVPNYYAPGYYVSNYYVPSYNTLNYYVYPVTSYPGYTNVTLDSVFGQTQLYFPTNAVYQSRTFVFGGYSR